MSTKKNSSVGSAASRKSLNRSSQSTRMSNDPPSSHRLKQKVVLVPQLPATASSSGSSTRKYDWLGELKQLQLKTNTDQRAGGTTYNVLSQPVRLELNKYFYEVTDSPNSAQRQRLIEELWHIDHTVTKAKLLKYFQNKRHYVKNLSAANSSSASNKKPRRRASTSSRRGSEAVLDDDTDSSDSS